MWPLRHALRHRAGMGMIHKPGSRVQAEANIRVGGSSCWLSGRSLTLTSCWPPRASVQSVELAKNNPRNAKRHAIRLPQNFTLPNPNHTPTAASKLAADFRVALDGAEKLMDPPFPARSPEGGAYGIDAVDDDSARMPKIAIDKYRHFRGHKDDVWSANEDPMVATISQP